MSTRITNFTKMKPLKLWFEFQYGLKPETIQIIEEGCKTIEKKGKAIYSVTKEKDRPAPPFKSPIPQPRCV
jgi:hypothetical protein